MKAGFKLNYSNVMKLPNTKYGPTDTSHQPVHCEHTEHMGAPMFNLTKNALLKGASSVAGLEPLPLPS